MIAAGRGIRFTRRHVFHSFLVFLCILQVRPASGCNSFLSFGSSSLILSSAVTYGFAAEAKFFGGANEREYAGDEKTLKLLDTFPAVESRNTPESTENVAEDGITGSVDEVGRSSDGVSTGDADNSSVEGEQDENEQLHPERRPRLRQQLKPSRQLDAANNNGRDGNDNKESIAHENGSYAVGSRGDGSENGDNKRTGMVKFRLGGKVESFTAGSVMQKYLNQLVEESVADTKNQTCNIAFVKTHKTASTTAATIFYRYGMRHNLNVANFYGHQSSIELPDAVKQIEQSGKPVDLMHYHHAWDGFYEGRWGDAKAAYKKIMRDPSVVNLVTVMREPVSHYMSYYYYFLQPEMGMSIIEYLDLSKRPDDPRLQGDFDQQRRAGKDIGWHGFKLLHNPLCAEFGIRTAQELEDFIRNDLPDFAMIMLTEQFEESLAVFMRMFNWRPIDMTYCRMIETKKGESRYDGKKLTNVPKIHELPPEALAEIKRQTQLDQALYKAAAKIYLEKRKMYEDRLEEDVRSIRTIQSAVHGYLDFDASSPAHEWYEGDVHCFADPSPVRPF